MASPVGAEICCQQDLEFSKWCSMVLLPRRRAIGFHVEQAWNHALLGDTFARWARNVQEKLGLQRCFALVNGWKVACAFRQWEIWVERIYRVYFRFVTRPLIGAWRRYIRNARQRRLECLVRASELTRRFKQRRTLFRLRSITQSLQRQYAFALQGIARRHWAHLTYLRCMKRWRKHVRFIQKLARVCNRLEVLSHSSILSNSWQLLLVFVDERQISQQRLGHAFQAWVRLCIRQRCLPSSRKFFEGLKRHAERKKVLRDTFTRLATAAREYLVSDASALSETLSKFGPWENVEQTCDHGVNMEIFREDFIRVAKFHRKWREERLLYGDELEVDTGDELEYASADINKSRKIMLNHCVNRHALHVFRKRSFRLQEEARSKAHKELLDRMDEIYHFDSLGSRDLPSSESKAWDDLQTPGYAKHMSVVERLNGLRLPGDNQNPPVL